MAGARDDSCPPQRDDAGDGSRKLPEAIVRGTGRGDEEAKDQSPRRDRVIQVESNDFPEEGTIAMRLRQILLQLARREDEIAHAEAAGVPYWAPEPTSVSAHRVAANSLRFEADRLLQAS